MNNFDLRKFLAENKLTSKSKLIKEELTPLQQYVFNYEKDINGEVSGNVLQAIKSLESAEDVYDYYANERGWEDDRDLKDDLKSIFKQVKSKFGGSDLTDLQQTALSYVKKRFGNDEAKKDLDIIKSFKERQEFLDYVKKKIEDENNSNSLSEVTIKDGKKLKKLTVGGKTYEKEEEDPSGEGRILTIEKYSNGYYITGGIYSDYGDGDEPKEQYSYAIDLKGNDIEEEELDMFNE